MSQPALRLFVALALPESVRRALASWSEPVIAEQDGLRAVALDGLHVTLCFLGMLAADAVPAVLAACSQLSGLPAAEVALGEPLWLAPRRPHVLAVSVHDPDRRLAEVQATLSRALSAGGLYEPERRPFLPHVTVARVRRGTRVRPRELEAPAPIAFVGRSVVLYRSNPGRGGARYEALGGVELRALG